MEDVKKLFDTGKLVISLKDLDFLDKEDYFLLTQLRNLAYNNDLEEGRYLIKDGRKIYLLEDYDKLNLEEIDSKDFLDMVPDFIEYSNIEEAIQKESVINLFNKGLVSIHTNTKEEYFNILGKIQNEDVTVGTIWTKNNVNLLIRHNKIVSTNLDNILVVDYSTI